MAYGTEYNFIRYDKNFVQWFDYSDAHRLVNKFKQTNYRKLKVYHLGDSHVQYDLLTGTLRESLQKAFGAGGRGMVFPYSIAGTNSAYDYASAHTGRWSTAKVTGRVRPYLLGMSGITARTSDVSATFTLVFAEGVIRDNFRKIKVFCDLSAESFDLKIHYSGQTETLVRRCDETGRSFVEFSLSHASDSLSFSFVRSETAQSYFELYGLMVESDTDAGVLYSSSGINGAGYRTAERMQLLPRQLADYNPDLVVLDMGCNDFRPGRFSAKTLGAYAVNLINKIRSAVPEATVLLTNPQDFYKGRRNVYEAKLFARMIEKIAADYHCLYYDYYEISGGRFSMQKWRNHGLSQKDKLHLKTGGYRLRGELYANGMLNSLRSALLQKQPRRLTINHLTTIDFVKPVFSKPYTAVKKPMLSSSWKSAKKPKADKILYTIRRGDNLGHIAEKFGLRANDLRRWNNLISDEIFFGKSLIVYTKEPARKKVRAVTYGSKKKHSSKISYKVKRGDSMWSIAKKFGTTTDKIAQLNGIRNKNKLKAGQVLQISR